MSSEKSCNVGKCTESKCPECGMHIDYNGNYFCHSFGTNPGDCRWGLPAWPYDSSPNGGAFPMTDEGTVRVARELGVIE